MARTGGKFVWQFLSWKKFGPRIYLKLCVSNGITATESLKKLRKCLVGSTLSRTQICERHKGVNEGHEVIENVTHASRQSVNDDDIKYVKET